MNTTMNEHIQTPRISTPVPAIGPAAGAPAAATTGAPEIPAFDVKNLDLWYGSKRAVEGVTFQIPSRNVTAIIGPSGCGNSTFIRTLHRMHELTPGARHTGTILMHVQDLYSPGVDATVVRRRVGMVFQKSNPFPTLSISENVLVGLRLNGMRDKALLSERLEKSLRMAALWDEIGRASCRARV